MSYIFRTKFKAFIIGYTVLYVFEKFIEMNEFTKAQVLEHAQFIKRGKPCSVLPMKLLNADYALQLAKTEGVKGFIRETSNENWCELWMYQRDGMREIINNLPEIPKSKIEHFVLGCAFGYSIDYILEYTRTIDDKIEKSFTRVWKNVKEELPKESGRYWCYVEEINDLGVSYYQSNCGFTIDHKIWSENLKIIKVLFWTELSDSPV